MDEYLSKKRRYDAEMENWDKENAKRYYLLLQHCPKEIKSELQNLESWKIAEDARSIIVILLLILDLSFNKTARKRSIMSIVVTDADLYLGTHRPDQITNNFYKTFNAQMDKINANEGSAGLHNGVYNKHILSL